MLKTFIAKLKTFLSGELGGWKWYEWGFLAFATLAIASISISLDDSAIGIVSSITGVVCVVMTAKGKLLAYPFGVVNCVLYAYVSYLATYYGETMLNLLYYLPLQFYGFAVWRKHIDSATCELVRRRMTIKNRVMTAMIMAIGVFVYGCVLTRMGDKMPFVDSFTTVASVVAMWISIKRYAEQWVIWIAIDVMTIWMWYVNYSTGNANIATLLMWVVFLMNAVYGLAKWWKNSES